MQTILVTSRKGGTGKSTIAVNLACEYCAAGLKVGIIDLDPQSTLSFWSSIRKLSATPHVFTCKSGNWLDQWHSFAEDKFDLVIVDTLPEEKKWIVDIMSRADMVLIPTRPTPLDIQSNLGTFMLARDIQANPFWVLNAAQQNTKLLTASSEILRKHGSVCKTVIHQRTDISLSFGLGLSVTEFDPNSKSSLEFKNLRIELDSKLKAFFTPPYSGLYLRKRHFGDQNKFS